jgi:hypothetical protein
MSYLDTRNSSLTISAKTYHIVNAGIANYKINYNIGEMQQTNYLTMYNINNLTGQNFTTEESQKWLVDNGFTKFVTPANSTVKTTSQKRRERRNKTKNKLVLK